MCAPANPTKTFALTEILDKHISPQPLVIAERFRFHMRNQHEGETVAQCVAQSRTLSEYCEFADNMGESLRDRLNKQKSGCCQIVTLHLTVHWTFL